MCKIWIGCLKDYSDQEITMAFSEAASSLTSWPAPEQIKRLCMTGELKSDEEIGQEISSRLESAISRFGYTSPDSAKEYLGQLGWKLVENLGGWVRVCSIDSNDELPSLRKLWRENAALLSKNYYSKGNNLPPALPSPKQNNFLLEALKIASNEL